PSHRLHGGVVSSEECSRARSFSLCLSQCQGSTGMPKRWTEDSPEWQRQHVEQLREEANRARLDSDWDQERAAWETVLRLVPEDALARVRLSVARQNQPWREEYRALVEQVAQGRTDQARVSLIQLWQQAPYYGDPQGIAATLGLTVPPSYE